MEIKNMMGNLEFGKIKGGDIAASVYGIAVLNKKDNTYSAYDKKNDDIIDVTDMTFDNSNMLYKMPVAIKDISKGDVVLHKGIPMFVTVDVENVKSIDVMDISAGERKVITPSRNMFGFNYVTKIVNIIEPMMGEVDESNPFGSLMPLMLLGGDGIDFQTLMLMQAMGGGKENSFGLDLSNPLMIMMLLSGENSPFRGPAGPMRPTGMKGESGVSYTPTGMKGESGESGVSYTTSIDPNAKKIITSSGNSGEFSF